MRVPIVACVWCLACGVASEAATTTNAAQTTNAADESGSNEDETLGAGDSGTTGATPDDRYHPDNFALPEVHGLATKLGVEDCRACHGSQLNGTAKVIGCDGCHDTGWRVDCVYCHGGDETDLGAPPRDIDGTTDLMELSFRSHTAHVTDGIKTAFDCTHCHVKPTNVLSHGHLFDDTPGTAEVSFEHGLSPAGTYAQQTCANLYCHGDGNGMLGVRTDVDPAPSCGDCHADGASPTKWATMSGEHTRHLNEGLACSDCHAATVAADGSIVQPLLHVNGRAETAFGGNSVTFGGASCNGACHGKFHFAEGW